MLIVITGTPGTGKTETCGRLGKMLGSDVIHLREFVKARKISSGFDRKTKSGIVDLRKLERELMKEITKLKTRNRKLVVEGHLACEIPLPADYVFVLRCKPKELEKRMRKRNYAEGKTRENLLAEMLDYCTQNAEVNYPDAKIHELETSGKTAGESAARIMKIISGRAKGDKVDYRKQLKNFLKLT